MKFIHESILMVIAGMLSLTATAADWPQYGGPDGRWVADAGDHAAFELGVDFDL